MTGKDVYKVWAPCSKKWVDWVKPVPFIGIDQEKSVHEFIDYDIPNINYIDKVYEDTLIIIDIPGVDSVKEGIALAIMGYRPIPIFNGTNPLVNTLATTNNEVIEELLVWGALELKNIEIKDDAPAVFLLDSNRLNRYKIDRSVFDNSWDVYGQDIPSYKYLLNNGISKVLVRGEKLNKDLEICLYKYYKNGIKILFTDGYDTAKEIKIKKPKVIDF